MGDHDKDLALKVKRLVRIYMQKAEVWWEAHGAPFARKMQKQYGSNQYLILVGVFTLLTWYAFSHDILYFISLLAELLRTFGVVLLVLRIVKKTQSVTGLSLKTQQLYTGVFATRLMFKVIYEQDYMYSIIETIAVALTGYIVYLMRGPHKATYQAESDTFKEQYILIPCLILAVVLHPNVTKRYLINVLWAFSTYLESVALLPQLFVFHSASRTVDNMTSLWIVSLFLSRVLECAFWIIALFFKGYRQAWGSIVWYVIITEIVHTLILMDFVRNFYKCYKQGMNMLLPSAWGFAGKESILGTFSPSGSPMKRQD
mmetsp:Transcript_67955/g.167847  ORF Transcript_67955/g.167847 Transcript_67955/m.167847 type:complete len:315 (-) Transcript_67955:325-1269(-)